MDSYCCRSLDKPSNSYQCIFTNRPAPISYGGKSNAADHIKKVTLNDTQEEAAETDETAETGDKSQENTTSKTDKLDNDLGYFRYIRFHMFVCFDFDSALLCIYAGL